MMGEIITTLIMNAFMSKFFSLFLALFLVGSVQAQTEAPRFVGGQQVADVGEVSDLVVEELRINTSIVDDAFVGDGSGLEAVLGYWAEDDSATAVVTDIKIREEDINNLGAFVLYFYDRVFAPDGNYDFIDGFESFKANSPEYKVFVFLNNADFTSEEIEKFQIKKATLEDIFELTNDLDEYFRNLIGVMEGELDDFVVIANDKYKYGSVQLEVSEGSLSLQSIPATDLVMPIPSKPSGKVIGVVLPRQPSLSLSI